MSGDALLSLVRRDLESGAVDYFEPVETGFLAEMTTGLPVWVDFAGDGTAGKICFADNPPEVYEV
ncbi:MAG TPA: hypothetical protein DEB31_08795 [Clostridiales bacterium]|nr:hypothetical protein [Clostridiales bacterium]